MSYQQGGYSDNPNANYGNSYSNQGYQQPGTNYGPGGNGYADEDNYDNEYARGQKNAYPMSAGNAYAAGGSPGYEKKKRNKWLWIGLPILILIIIGAVLGGVLGTQLGGDDNKGSNNASNGNSNTDANTGLPSGVTSINTATSTGANGQRYLAVATDSNYLPVYATGTATAGYSAPTRLSNAAANGRWPDDPNPPSSSAIRAHPRIGAPGYKWQALNAGLIANDPYLNFWNTSIVNNASATIGDEPVPYITDGGLDGSGVLDIAREMKLKVKNWAFAYRVTNETRYAERVWREVQTASGNNPDVAFGNGDLRWNPAHFLDVGEFCAMFAIAYDWLYDYWTDEQRDQMMSSIITLGLQYGDQALAGTAPSSIPSWWTGAPRNSEVNGNWNCVINGGLTMAALAIIDRDTTGIAERVVNAAVDSARQNCFQAPEADGSWAETSDYWYFGTTGAAEMVAALNGAYGDDRGLSTANAGFAQTSYYHMYVTGMTYKFNYGDHGPNKFSTTANSLMLWSTQFNEPRFALYQRDHNDAPEPWSMFWYDPALSGTWWDGLPLDRHFSAQETEWATGRDTWSENSGLFWAMKAGRLTGHQTHGDLDLGDFVVDAMGQRFFGELGSGEYLSPGYFSSEAQDSQRWLYYRKRTEGQNTILIGNQNQFVSAEPTTNFGTSNVSQGAAPSFDVATDDTAFFTADISSGYNATVKRGIRFLNGRRQILIQDDISGVPSGTDVQWRAHTNASVTVDTATPTVATLVLNSQTMMATILNAPSGVAFSTASATSDSSDPAPPTPTGEQKAGNLANPGVTVLVIDNTNGGDFSFQVLLNPQWSGMESSAFVTPSSVNIDNWSLTSHN